MRNLFLLFSLVALALSQALDFADNLPRGAGTDYWLSDDVVYTANIEGRADLEGSIVEIAFSGVEDGYPCYYSIWVDGDKVSWGGFTNVGENIVPLLTGTIVAGASELTVQLDGCSLGRYAVPFLFNDASGYTLASTSVELVDVTPAAQAGLTYYSAPGVAGNPVPAGFISGQIPDNDVDWNRALILAGLSDGICLFSSQACDTSNNPAGAQPFVAVAGNNQVGQPVVFLTWSNFDTTQNLVVEFSFWSTHSQEIDVYGCQLATLDCNNFNNYNAEGYTVQSNTGFQGSFWSGVTDRAHSGQDENKFTRLFYQAALDNTLYEEVLALYLYSAAIHFPYIKVWSLDVTDDPLHQVTRLSEADDCLETSFGSAAVGVTKALNTYTQGSAGFGYNILTGSQESGIFSTAYYSNTLGSLNFGNQFFCTASSQAFIGATCVDATAYPAVATTNGKNPGTTSTASFDGGALSGIAFDDGFALMYGLDQGLGFLYCQTFAQPAPTFNSFFDISVAPGTGTNYVVAATVNDYIVKNPSGTHYSKGLGSPIGIPLDAGLTGGFSIKFESRVGFSMSFVPLVFVHAIQAPSCNTSTDCSGVGTCRSVGSQCDCNGGDLLYSGAACDILVQYCTSQSCNGVGLCTENPARSLDTTNPEWVVDAISCNCTGTATTPGGTDFQGKFCEIPPPCDQNPCLNQGVCDDSTGVWSCDCSATVSPNSARSFTGKHCEISGTRPCDLNPCQNSGACVDTGPGSFPVCNCAATGGYIGTFCEVSPIDKCVAEQCGNHGHCIADAVAPFTRCVCTDGWGGLACDVEPAACNGLCQNAGICVALAQVSAGTQADVYSCICPAPFVGMWCQWNETQWNSAPGSSVGLFATVLVALFATLF